MKPLTLTHAQTGKKMTIMAEHILALVPMTIYDDLKLEHHSTAKTEVVIGPSQNYHVRESAIDLAAMISRSHLALVPVEPVESEMDPFPDDPAPIADKAVDYVFGSLAKALGLERFNVADGSESWVGDVHGTLMNILHDAGVLDPETNEAKFVK